MKKPRLLIVETQWVITEGLKSILSTLGEFRIVGTAAGETDAVRKVGTLKPDIIVLGISGFMNPWKDTILQIRKIESHAKILVFSTGTSSESAHELLEAGVDGYVLKSDPVEELVQALRVVRDGGVYVSKRVERVLSVHGKLPEEYNHITLRILTAREREVLELLVAGKSIRDAAKELGVSPKTVETHKYKIMRKLDVRSVGELAKIMLEGKEGE